MSADIIRILHVDDEPDFAEMTATFLRREDERFVVETADTASEGLDQLSEADVDCVVSDYEMPDTDGIEFLEAVRGTHPDLPFVLFTGKGSEEIASEAISAGVSDYLQKGSGTSQYTVLANRIRNVVGQYRSERALEESRDRLSLFFEQSPFGVVEWNESFEAVRVNEAAENILGYAESELAGESWETIVPESDRDAVTEVVTELLENKGGYRSVNENLTKDGDRIVCEWYNRVITDESNEVVAVFSQFQEVTEERRRRERQRRQRDALVELATDEAVANGAFRTALRRITEAAADVLDVERVSVWLFDEDGERSRCVEQYDRRTDSYERGMELNVDEYPEYYEAVESNRVIAADDARSDPRTSGLTEPYLNENGIGALLDATLRSEGEFVGVVCHEHMGGPRKWTNDEMQFAADIADIVHRALRNNKERDKERNRKFRESLLKAQQEAIIDGLLVTNDKQEVISYNSRFVEMWKISEEIEERADDTKADVLEVVIDRLNDPSTFREQIEYLTENPEETGRNEIERTDGRVFDWYSAPVIDRDETYYGRLWLFRDITDRKRRERELERYETILEALGDPVYALDADGCYTFVNEAFVGEIGYTREEILGRHVSVVLPESDVERGREIVRELLSKDDDRTATWEMTRITADGERIPAESHIALLPPAEDGSFRGTAGVVRDISERIERERKLERQNERLEEFASVVSHDLRNPLNVAKGRLQLAYEEDSEEDLEAVAAAHERMEVLIENLLTLAREGEAVVEREAIDLAGVVGECWGIVETADATLITDIDRTVRADKSRLKQLFENLIRNAVEHGGEDVTVTIGTLESGFYVEDDGPGVPAADREAVFEPGYSSAANGNGFGLSIVKRIVDAHEWEIRIIDGSEGGARFEITGVTFVE